MEESRTHRARFAELTEWLESYFELWSARPFVGLPVSWEEYHPAMAGALCGLSTDEIERAQDDPASFTNVPEPFGTLAAGCRALASWPGLPRTKLSLRPPLRVPGRKWRQIEHFIATVHACASPDLNCWVDWCSGKGHLGRTLAQALGVSCTGLELDPVLCERGALEARQMGAKLTLQNADVLTDDVGRELGEGIGVVALHACGELNMKLLETAVPKCPFIALAPCCYHRLPGEFYQPLSDAGREGGLKLSRHHLLLAAYDENIAGASDRILRRREQAWRLAVDLLQREGTGIDRYKPLGAVPVARLKGSFADFADHLQLRHGLTYPVNWSASRAEAQGWDRARIVGALSLVRGLFRRVLESWAVLDRVLYLEEAGYRVLAGEFCPREVTPRNLMVIGTRPS